MSTRRTLRDWRIARAQAVSRYLDPIQRAISCVATADVVSLAAQEIAAVDDRTTTLTVPGVSPSVRIYDFTRWTARLVRDTVTYSRRGVRPRVTR